MAGKGNPNGVPNSEATRFKKGQSGNPSGPTKKLPELDKLLAEVLGEEKEGITAAETILKVLRMKASKGDIRAAELLLDRAYGKSKQHIDFLSGGKAIDSTPVINVYNHGPKFASSEDEIDDNKPDSE